MSTLSELLSENLKQISDEESKASTIRLHRVPQKNMMPGLAESDNEWDTLAKFYSASTPSDLKAKMFSFIELVNIGRITLTINDE